MNLNLASRWSKVAVAVVVTVVGLIAANQLNITGSNAAYNYGYYGGGQNLAIITGAGPGGGPHIQVINPASLGLIGSFMAPEPPGNYAGGTYVARGDLNGNGTTAEIAIGELGVVKIRNANGTPPTTDFTPYSGFNGETRVATGDLDGDGKAEIITAAGPGGGPHIRAFKADGSDVTAYPGTLGSPGIFAYGSAFSGGVYVTTADLNSDGKAEIITGAGAGGGPHVRAFNADGTPFAGVLGNGFFAYGASFNGGVRVAAGYLNNTLGMTIVTGAGPGGGPHVREFGLNGLPVAGQAGAGWYAYGANFAGGVFVALGDIDADEPAEIVTGAGAGGGPHVRVFKANGTAAPGVLGEGFFAYAQNFTGGVTVAAGKV
jgi:hypothetical protein